jgi:hypothetical protein
VYYGNVQVASNTVGNSPQAVSVMLTVLSSPPAPPPMWPSGLILQAQPATTQGTDTVTITNPWNTTMAYSSNVVTDNSGTWLSASPASGTVAAGASATLTVTANVKGMSAGLAHGVVRVAFVDGTVHTVDVYVIVPPGAATISALPIAGTMMSRPEAVAQTCPGTTGIVVVMRSPEPGFLLKAQVPVPLQLIARDCATGRLVKQLGGALEQVVIGTKDSPTIPLVDDGSGVWTGTWTPSTASAQLGIAARVDQYVGASATVVSGVDYLSGTVEAAPDGAAGVVTAVINDGNSQSVAGSVSPGSLVSLFGVGMGDGEASALQTPYPSLLGGTQVLLQGLPLPLTRVSATQVDAMIPSGINANERQQIIVQRGSTQSPSVDVRVTTGP